MAVLDTTENEIVIRVVYDGPPEAGKTTSLRALAGSLAQTMTTPEEDGEGRTMWFDWMEYVGGRFEGSRIRCQIASVPGQRALSHRRRHLLAGADVIVSVLDSTPAGLASSLEYLTELRTHLAGQDPPVGVVVQANKRDVASAVELVELRTATATAFGGSVGVIESIAADGTGIRETFVYAVRLALDRVRELMTSGNLEIGPPQLRGADDLLAALRGVEVASPPVIADDASSLAATALIDVLEAEAGAHVRSAMPVATRVPRAPDASVPSGTIWPPVEGRAILYEVSQLALAPHQLRNGDWVMGLGCGWRVVSRRDACYATLDEGRAALIAWARLHAASLSVISPQRCIVLADAGDGSWRLWQIVRAELSLRETVMRDLDGETAEVIVLRLCQGGKQLLEAAARLHGAPCELPCTLDTVGIAAGLSVYIGLMPSSPPDPLLRGAPLVLPALLRSQLEPLVAAVRAGGRGRALQGVIDRVPRPIRDPDGVMTTLVSLFA